MNGTKKRFSVFVKINVFAIGIHLALTFVLSQRHFVLDDPAASIFPIILLRIAALFLLYSLYQLVRSLIAAKKTQTLGMLKAPLSIITLWLITLLFEFPVFFPGITLAEFGPFASLVALQILGF